MLNGLTVPVLVVRAWGGENPWSVPFFILTHRTEDEPPNSGFTFVSGLESALDGHVWRRVTRTLDSWVARTPFGKHWPAARWTN
jgi:hypothetical protein